ncbi:MAG: DUF2207 domain-containing protein [Actinomycetota bacterium]|nr:DUF2207 domain-containing protein [Actinomycetota bacterium]
MRSSRRRLSAFLAAALVAVAALAAMPESAFAQGAESIDSYNVAIEIRPSGQLHVQEVIAYNFGYSSRHGIYRNIPERFRFDDKYDRVYNIRNVKVTASPGTPSDVAESDTNNNKVLRIGNPDKTVTGAHTYTIEYDVEGALNRFPEHDELYWNGIGTEWDVPIQRPAVTVTGPVAITNAACFAGAFGSNLPCDSAGGTGSTEATFTNTALAPNQGLTVVIAMPRGAVASTGPIVEERWSLARAFEITAVTVAAALGLFAIGMALIMWLIWRKGRDRRAAGAGVEYGPGAPGPAGAGDESVPLFAERSGPVAFRPPEGLHPAQVGVLVDESADAVDVTATIVDLAVRGYLVIEELEREHMWSKQDWRLRKLKAADDTLLPYENDLLSSLFTSGDEVDLSDLKNTFHASLVRIEGKLYDDAVGQGWFTRRPDKVRSQWLVLGILLAVLGAGAVVAAAAWTHLALIPVPLVVVGLVLAIGHRWMPARTAKGSATLSQVLGFRRYIETAEVDRMQFAEEENIWAKYLPYAIVFGATKKWAKAFAGLEAQAAAQSGMGWYVSPYPFQMMAFSSSMDAFANSTSGIIVSTPSGGGASGSGFSGGGFSGGGGGGGGGGSW